LEICKIINIIGLGCDIVGVVLIWRYGLPRSIEAAVAWKTTPYEKEERKYKLMDKLGLIFIVTGFFIQIVSSFF
jgi:hypothetical protein